MTFEPNQPVIVRHTDGRGQSLVLQGIIADPAAINRPVVKGAQWVHVGGVVLLVDEELIDAKQSSDAEVQEGPAPVGEQERQEGH